MFKRIAGPASRALAVATTASLAGVLALAAAEPASAAFTPSHYQEMAKLSCLKGNTFCSATFPKLAANRALDIDHAACEVYSTDLQVAMLLVDFNFFYPLPVQSRHPDVTGAHQVFTLGGDVNVRVPLGKQVIVSFYIPGETDGYCSITGTLYTKS